ncbi:MAG: DUF167 domain-containing protein [Leptolyngbya sp. SIO1D8]|nr:DUF167 domain-containing protein [Leptolyngbya sp. SIO1D8]
MVILRIRVKPNAKQSRIQKTESGEWVVSLSAPPVGGKANQALIKLLAQELNVSKSRIHIKSGHTGRHKLIEIEGDLP